MNASSHSLDVSVATAAVPLQQPDPSVPAETYAEVARLGLADQFSEVVALTHEIFGDFTIRISADPEIDDCSYVTFQVRSVGASDDAFEKESQWIRRLPRCPTEATGSFCISVDFIE